MINNCEYTITCGRNRTIDFCGRNRTIDFEVNHDARTAIVSELITSIISTESASINHDISSLATNLLTASSHNILFLKYISPITPATLVHHGEIIISAVCYKGELSNYCFRVLDAGKPFKMGIDYRLSTLQIIDMLEKNICWVKHFRLSNVRIDISEGEMCCNIGITGNIVSALPKNGVALPDASLQAANICPVSSLDENYEKRKMTNFFKVKDARVSKDRTIIFWEDGTKTVIKKAEVEKDFDLEKAIMAAFTRRALSFGHTAKERSVDETIDSIACMINDHLDYEEAKRNKRINS